MFREMIHHRLTPSALPRTTLRGKTSVEADDAVAASLEAPSAASESPWEDAAAHRPGLVFLEQTARRARTAAARARSDETNGHRSSPGLLQLREGEGASQSPGGAVAAPQAVEDSAKKAVATSKRAALVRPTAGITAGSYKYRPGLYRPTTTSTALSFMP